MAKHAKPTPIRTLSTTGARGAAALAIASAGLLTTTPTAFAGGDEAGHHEHGDIDYRWSNDAVETHESSGVVDVADNTVAVPIQVCDNYVPVNVVGVQVPIQEVAGTVAVSSDGDGQVAVSPDSCRQTGQQTD